MKKIKLGTIQYINIEHIPEEFRDWVWEKLPINGGNVITVEANTRFGNWLEEQGFLFTGKKKKTWQHLVVFR